MSKPRIAIPVPHSQRPDYNERALPLYLSALEESGAEPVVIPLDASPEDVARAVTSCQGVLLPGSPADLDPAKYDAPKDHRTNPSDPERDRVDELLLQDAHNMRKPILGICYGLQSLNVWRNGTLVQHLPSQSVNHEAGRDVPRAHTVAIEPDTLLDAILRAAYEPAVAGQGYARNSHPRPRKPLLPPGHPHAEDFPDFTDLELPVNSSHHQAAAQIGDGLRLAARCSADATIEAIENAGESHWVVGVQWHPERTVDTEESSRTIFKAFVDAAAAWKEPRN